MGQPCVSTRLRIRAVCRVSHVTGRHAGETSSERTGVMDQIGHSKNHTARRCTPERTHRDQCCVTSTDHGERLCRHARATTQMAHRSRAWRTRRTPQQGEHETVTVTPIHTSGRLNDTAPLMKRCDPRRRTGGEWGLVLVQPTPERNTTVRMWAHSQRGTPMKDTWGDVETGEVPLRDSTPRGV